VCGSNPDGIDDRHRPDARETGNRETGTVFTLLGRAHKNGSGAKNINVQNYNRSLPSGVQGGGESGVHQAKKQ